MITQSRCCQGKIRVVFLLLCVIALISVLVFFAKQTSNDVVSPIPKESIVDQLIPFFTPKRSGDELKRQIEKQIGTNLKNYSVVVKDFSSDFQLSVNENVMFTAASVNKVPILAVLYYLAQKGDVDLDKVITIQEDDIQDYGTGSIRYEGAGSTYSVKTLARLMMQQSDNTAAYVLARQIIGINKIQDILAGWGLSQTDMETNKTSNADMMILMERMYNEKIAGKALTLEMLSFLKDTDFEDRIPAKLPKDTIVYHKTGNEVGFLHDVGIVVTPKSRYYLGLFTADVTDEAKTIQLLSDLSLMVYKFMK